MVIRIEMKGIHRVRKALANGKTATYFYAWRGGPRLEGKPGTADFKASYDRAIASRQAVPSGNFFSVISAYKASGEFSKLAARTRADYLRHIAGIEAKFGTMPLSGFSEANKRVTRGVFKSWRDDLATKSMRQADYAWSVLGRICSWGLDRGRVATNPCERGGRLYESERNDNVWTDADEARFIAKAPKHLHLALLLAVWTGQRQGDLLRLTWSNYDGTNIRLRQGKTGKRLVVPVGAPLKSALDAEASRKRGALMLLTRDGERWTEDGFRSSWAKACAKAGIEGLTFHDLRGSAVTRLALAGATVPEIATFTGHSLRDVESILDSHYLSRDQGLAASAIRKLERRGEQPEP
ncbi:integrase [Camelimonas fluminis]|uniref:Tyrosine-type recombinase/integrase n=1 Tax=Camelimonas fluminis TaxID=1576911 RepID=A0ABV7UNU1_9HYPH|nr:site-specific integrase [Camelimonas fluminis]GHE83211.1 integrase [Camelimonas fluminis]